MSHISLALQLLEKAKFNNWVMPSVKDLELEYNIEYKIKPLKKMLGDPWPTKEHFLKAASDGEIRTVSKSLNSKISYRSNTASKEQIISLIKGYASYPQFRNEQTIDSIYNGFKNNEPMKTPIVLVLPGGKLRIMSGNTRMDIAFQLGVEVKALFIEV